MTIEDLTPENEKLYFVCLEDWSDEIKEAGSHKEKWYCSVKEKGLRVKIARDDKGIIGGMIQYLPIEHSFVEGEDLYVIYCIWVHGYKEGRGDFRRKGLGKALLAAAEEDVKKLGGKGLAAWGIILPFWMKASWYKKQRYRIVDREGISVLLWKPFSDDAKTPKMIKQKKKPAAEPGKVTVTSFINGWCSAQNIVYERAKKAAGEFNEKVIFKEYDTSERGIFLEWGILDALYIDDKKINTGPPPSYEKIRKKIQKRIDKLH